MSEVETFVVCVDDDHNTLGNPGLTKGNEAAQAVDGKVAIPMFGDNRPEDATDFNDMRRLHGDEAVKRCIDTLIHATTPQSLLPQPTSCNNFPPSEEERPCFIVMNGWFSHGSKRHRPGVYYCYLTVHAKKDAEPIPVEQWICAPMTVEAITYDTQENNFGRLLRFTNSLGNVREYAMPMELLKSYGDELRGELLAMGLEMDTNKARQRIIEYLQFQSPKRRVRCALQVGWFNGSFVLPDQVIGDNATDVIFQSGERNNNEHTVAGTLEGWRENIGVLAIRNPLLLFALSVAFAGPMLSLCNVDGGGVHYFGDSSTGKSTTMDAACSVWGGINFRRSWRSTSNGMEGVAALFNDCLLALDEISECDPKEIGAIVYSLGNGRGKQRAGKSGAARAITRWRCMVMSNGEKTVATAMAEGGYRIKAGQSVRILDVPVSEVYGVFSELHGRLNGEALSNEIKHIATQHYGKVGRAFLERLTRDERDFCAMLAEFKALPLFATSDGEGQDKRAANRFVLIGLAGELATEYGLTGWPEGEAMKAAAYCYRLWQSARGPRNDENRQITEYLSSFIERHGDSRFSSIETDDAIRERAGWWVNDDDGRKYLFTSGGLREALKGFDFNKTLAVLEHLGVLPKSKANGERSQSFNIGSGISKRKVRLYKINPDRLGVN